VADIFVSYTSSDRDMGGALSLIETALAAHKKFLAPTTPTTPGPKLRPRDGGRAGGDRRAKFGL